MVCILWLKIKNYIIKFKKRWLNILYLLYTKKNSYLLVWIRLGNFDIKFQILTAYRLHAYIVHTVIYLQNV